MEPVGATDTCAAFLVPVFNLLFEFFDRFEKKLLFAEKFHFEILKSEIFPKRIFGMPKDFLDFWENLGFQNFKMEFLREKKFFFKSVKKNEKLILSGY